MKKLFAILLVSQLAGCVAVPVAPAPSPYYAPAPAYVAYPASGYYYSAPGYYRRDYGYGYGHRY